MKPEMPDIETSDAELLRSFSQGESTAMDQLVARYRQALFSWLLGMTGNHADAEDMYQEVWFRVIRHAGRFNDVSFRAWLWKIARNLLIDFRRKRRPDVSLDAVENEDAVPLVDQLTSREMGPARSVEMDDLTKRVMRAVTLLPAVQRDVFLMRVEGNLSFTEIAETLDIPLNTALGRMHDAMMKLKKFGRGDPDMKTETPFTDIAELEKELAQIAPLVRQGFRQVGGPSLRVENAIRSEALRHAAKKQTQRAWPLYRRLAAVAAVALVLFGTIQVHISKQADIKAAIAKAKASDSADKQTQPAEGTHGFATLLLEIQGLNEDGFFRPEEAEPLWL